MAKKASLKGTLSLDITAFERGLGKALSKSKSFAKDVAAYASGQLVAKGLENLARGIVNASERFEEGVKAAYEMGAALQETSARTGIASGQIMILNQVFKEAGVDAGNLGGMVNKMQRFIDASANASGAAAAKLGDLGISYSRLAGMAPDEQFKAIGTAIENVSDPARRAADAIAIFGRAGGELLPVFAQLKEGDLPGIMNSIGRQAKILSDNGGFFKAISDLIGHMQNKSSGFFTGMANSLSERVFLILSKIDAMDFASMGEKIGSAIGKFMDAVYGAFKNPQIFIDLLLNAFMYASASMGNMLVTAFKIGKAFFQNGMLDAIQGIGLVLLGTMMKAFAVPIAYMQAAIEDVLYRLPKSLGGSGEREAAQGEYDQSSDKLARLYNARAAEAADNNPALASTKAQTLASYDRDIAAQKELNDFNFKKAQSQVTIDDRAKAHLSGGGPMASTASGDMNADTAISTGMALVERSINAASKDIIAGVMGTQTDVFGAARYGAGMKSDYNKLAQSGNVPQNVPLQGYYNNQPIALNSKLAYQLRSQMGEKKFLETIYAGQTGGKEYAAQKSYSATHAAPSKAYLAQLVGQFGASAVFGNKATGAPGMLDSSGMLAKNAAVSRGSGSASKSWYDVAWSNGRHVQGAHGLGSNGGLDRGSYGHHFVNKAAEARWKKSHGQGEKTAANIGDLGRKIDRPAWTQEAN